MPKQIKNGFGMVEIVLSLGIFLIVMTAVFQYSAVLYEKIYTHQHVPTTKVFPHGLDLYRYGETFCDIPSNVTIRDQIDLSQIISTSTPVTDMQYIGDDTFIFTTDSASTTEPDVFKVRITANGVVILETKDVGPGLQDSLLMFPYLYVANTSVNSHVKVLRVDPTLSEMQNIRIQTLTTSNAMPRRLSIFGKHLMLGAEKSAAGGELFPLAVVAGSTLTLPTQELELGGQAHASRVIGDRLYTANSADPEMRVFNSEFTEINSYDAPLTLGNGKSVLGIYPYIILGRTLGTGELTLIDNSSTTFTAIDTERTNGSVDHLQFIGADTFMVLTSNSDKEIQFWKIENKQLLFVSSINLLARSTAYTCVNHKLYIAILINEKPNLIILQ